MTDATNPTAIPVSAPTPVPFGDPAPTEAIHTEAAVPPSGDLVINFDFSPVSDAAGSPSAWARYLREYLGHTTGSWIDVDDLTDVFTAFSGQAATDQLREASFSVANMQVPSKLAGDPAVVALQMRGDIAAMLRKRAGMTS